MTGSAAGVGLICYGMTRDASKPVAIRVGVCLAIIAACWIIYPLLAAVFLSALHRR